jgi:membrane fusion protein (multidrug efflux system)
MHPATRTSALALAVLLAACGKKEAAPVARVPEITVVTAVQRDIPVGGELVATLHGDQDTDMRARVEGYLKSVDYKEGSEVKKGQLLFTIDDQPYRAALAQARGAEARARAAFNKADQDVKRFQPLVAQRAISQAELDNALSARDAGKAALDAALADTEKAQLNVGYARITSPVNGVAGKAEKKVGDLVGKGEATLLTTVSVVDPMRATVNIPEAIYIKNADKLAAAEANSKLPPSAEGSQLQLSDGTLYPLRGRLVLVDRAVDPTTGTLRAEIAFANPKRTLRPGMYGKLIFKNEQLTGAVLVPQKAVTELQGTFSLLVVGPDDLVHQKAVKPGPRVGELWVMETGVAAGERVVVAGFAGLKEGAKVKAVEAPAPAPPAPAPGPAASNAVTPPVPAPSTPPATK